MFDHHVIKTEGLECEARRWKTLKCGGWISDCCGAIVVVHSDIVYNLLDVTEIAATYLYRPRKITNCEKALETYLWPLENFKTQK